MSDRALSVQPLSNADADAVASLARIVWQATYPALISQAQIDFMLADRYAAERIRAQMADPRHAWRVARQGQALVGFSHALLEEAGCKLDKLYVHPDCQRRGIGAVLLREVEAWARVQRARRLWLQVNRGNMPAVRAYEKYGFHIVASRAFDIGGGFVMDDHVMEKML